MISRSRARCDTCGAKGIVSGTPCCQGCWDRVKPGAKAEYWLSMQRSMQAPDVAKFVEKARSRVSLAAAGFSG